MTCRYTYPLRNQKTLNELLVFSVNSTEQLCQQRQEGRGATARKRALVVRQHKAEQAREAALYASYRWKIEIVEGYSVIVRATVISKYDERYE